ncbi:MAG: hypothetical protein ABSB19_18445, partial [Methylomonas sp.]
FFYNTIGIPVAAGLLYPFFGVLLNPMFAGAAMALSSVTVVSNANRLRWITLDAGLQIGHADWPGHKYIDSAINLIDRVKT